MRGAGRYRDHLVAITDSGVGQLQGGELKVLINGRPAAVLSTYGIFPNLARAGEAGCNCTEAVSGVMIAGKLATGEGLKVRMPKTGDSGTISSSSGDVFIGGPVVSMEELARHRAIEKLRLAEASLERWNASDRARFKKWFGTDSPEARQEILEGLRKARRRLEHAPLEQGEATDSAAAHLRGHGIIDETIYLDEFFWLQSPESQADTLVHESSHYWDVGLTDDDLKSDDGHQHEKAKESPEDALESAYIWEGFVGEAAGSE